MAGRLNAPPGPQAAEDFFWAEDTAAAPVAEEDPPLPRPGVPPLRLEEPTTATPQSDAPLLLGLPDPPDSALRTSPGSRSSTAKLRTARSRHAAAMSSASYRTHSESRKESLQNLGSVLYAIFNTCHGGGQWRRWPIKMEDATSRTHRKNGTRAKIPQRFL